MRRFLVLIPLVFLSWGLCAQGRAVPQDGRPNVEFEGNKVFSSQKLGDLLNLCLDRYSHARNEETVLDYCLRDQLLNHLRRRGHLRAEVGKPRGRETGDGLKYVVAVEEGLLYRIGEIQIEGPKVFTPEQLLEMFTRKKGDIADYEAILGWLHKRLKRAYEERGHIQYDYEVEPEFKPAPAGGQEGVADLKITVNEGPQFVVNRIEFVGNARTRDDVLRLALLIREGDTFNRKRLDESVRNLNGLGLFKLIDADRDVEFRSDEARSTLDLTIRVKEKGGQP